MYSSLRNADFFDLRIQNVKGLADFIDLASNYNPYGRIYILLSLIIVNMNKQLDKLYVEKIKYSNLKYIIFEARDIKK